MKKIKYFVGIVFVLFLASIYFVSHQIYSERSISGEKISFEIQPGESATALANNLQSQKIISSPKIFKLYLKLTGADKNIQSGFFEVSRPFTLAHIAETLKNAKSIERTITIIPGWDLRDIAKYFEAEGIVSSTEFFALTGTPAKFGSWASSTFAEYSLLKSKPENVSLEGYLAPETYRIYKNEKIESILKRLLSEQESNFTPEMLQEIHRQGKTVHEIVTLASILEKEVKTPEDRKKVSDLFWRRIENGMGLQADSTVHYLSGREGDVFTKQTERQIDSLYNTYKYRGLPPGPIANPSVSSLLAAIYPTPNNAVYFLTTSSGEVVYAKTLAEHNANVQKYLR